MKMTTFFLLAFLLQVSAKGTAQVTLKEKSASLEKVLKKIKQQSGYGFAYDDALLRSKAKPVTVAVDNKPVEEALRLVFDQQNELTYTLNGKIISVKAKEEKKAATGINPGINPMDMSSPPADITVKGTVKNENGEPIPGASIQIKGTKRGTSADGNGSFTLTNVPDNATLIVSGTNIETVEMRVQGRTELSITTKLKVSELEEVVVGKGYYEEKQRLTVGNTVRVTAKDIEKQPVQDVLQALQGRVTGLNITQTSGIAGSAVAVRIKGQNSIGQGNLPLYLVDGVPMVNRLSAVGSTGVDVLGNLSEGFGSPLSLMDINDIETVDILKDAEATALYGTRAANGAIIITTKKGKSGKTQFNISFQESFSKVTRLSPVLNRRQYLDMRYEAFRNDGLIPSNNSAASGLNVFAPDLTIWDTTRDENWQKMLLGGTAKNQNLDFDLTGGTSSLSYIFSGSYNRNNSIFSEQLFNQRGSFSFGMNSSSLNNRLKLSLKANYFFDQNLLPPTDLTSVASRLPPIAPPLLNADGSLNWAIDPSGYSPWASSSHPFSSILLSNYEIKSRVFRNNIQASYSIFPTLTLQLSAGYLRTDRESFWGSPLEAVAPDVRATRQRAAQYGQGSNITWNMEPQISYTDRIGRGVLTGRVGGTLQQSSETSTTIQGLGYSSDNILRNPAGAPTISVLSPAFNEYKYLGVFGHLNYNISETYIISLNGRRDGSSRFGSNNRFANFGSLGAAWIFTNSNFFKKQSLLSFGKFRSSYGLTGSDAIGDYSYMSLYTPGSAAIPYLGVSVLTPGAPNNPNLQWEENRKFQLGIDLEFFKRIRISATYSRNRSSNQIVGYSTPATVGTSNISINQNAIVQNSSIELELNSVNVKNKVFEWSTNFNLTIARNKLVSFPDLAKTPLVNSLIIGQSLRTTRIYRFAGVDPATGLYQFYDRDNNITFTPSAGTDQILVTRFPKYYGGLENNIRYKSLDLSFHFYFIKQIGIAVYSVGTPGRFLASGLSGNQYTTVLDRWQKPGDHAIIQRFSTSTTGVSTQDNLVRGSDYIFTDASFIRLRNVSLSWKVPSNVLQAVHLRDLRLSLRGENLFTITRYPGNDPENQGNSSLPPLRVLSFAVNIGL